MRIFIGADHRGFELKENIKAWMSENDIAYQDVGAHDLDENDDYPIYAEKLAESVSTDLGEDKESRGIIICGSGVGVDVVANKFDGIRSGLGMNREQIEAARRDDNINVLAIASDFTDLAASIEMIDAFINTHYKDGGKHARRLDEIEEIEKNN